MRVGILGGGQLGRMLALAGYPLGLRFRVLDPAPDATAGRLAEHVAGAFDDDDALRRFAGDLDVATYEFENVPAAVAAKVAAMVPLLPPPAALEAAQDRLVEKSTFRRLEIPTAPFLAVDGRAQLEAAVSELGLPAVLKTRRMGYDGKGQFVLRSRADLDRAWAALGGARLLLEAFVPFDRELSALAVRGRGGETAFYPLVENHHHDGILRISRAPAAGLTAELQAQAEELAAKLMASLDYVGVLAVELFQHGDRLLANEFAPRVHNSGHWTIEGAETSQFENHLRAVAGWPLGGTAAAGHAAMVNLIGSLPDPAALLAVPHAHLHLYDKVPAPRRKLGHVTIRADDPEAVEMALARVRRIVG